MYNRMWPAYGTKIKYDRIKHFKEILNDTFIIEAKAKQLHY